MQVRNTFALGLSSIIGLAGLAVLLFLFGSKSWIADDGWPLLVHTSDAGGLREGSAVLVNGVQVGRVLTVDLQEHPVYPVEVRASIGREHVILKPAQFQITEPLIGGSATLNIIGAATGTPFPKDATEAMEGMHRSQLEMMTDLMTREFTPLMEAMEAFRQFSETYAALGQELQELLGDNVTEPGNLRTSVVRVNELLEELTLSVEAANALLRDEDLKAKFTTATDEATKLFENASEAAANVSELAVTFQTETQRVMEKVLPALDQAAATLEEIQRIAIMAREGDGTMAQFLQNPDLYKSLDDAARRLDATLVELQLLIRKVKTEGMPVNF